MENVNCVSLQKVTMSILKVHAREIFDSRGNPTVEVDLFTAKGMCHLCSYSPLHHIPFFFKASNDSLRQETACGLESLSF